MDGENETPIIEDDAALDKVLQESIDAVNAGNTLDENPDKPEGEEKPEGEAAPEGQDDSTPAADKPEGSDDPFRIPNQGKFESDEAYQKRVELFDLVKRRKAAETPEAKAKLSDEIKAAKSQLKNLNGSDRFSNLNKPEGENNGEEIDPSLKADQEILQKIGGATKDDIAQIIAEERFKQDVASTVNTFVERVPELKDEDMREVFFDFVEENYKWQDKSGKELLTILELARESMFKPNESIQERVLKGANVAEKVNAMQFPGGTSGRADGLSADQKESVKQMVATGMSEEKALALISD